MCSFDRDFKEKMRKPINLFLIDNIKNYRCTKKSLDYTINCEHTKYQWDPFTLTIELMQFLWQLPVFTE